MAIDVLPPVTVLLPVFNGGSRLPQAVESVLAQSHEHFELLVIDDGSDDGTADYLDSLADPRVRVLKQPNQGLVRSLNRGLAEASHPFVARMDADDVSEPERLAVQIRFLVENPRVAAVGSCFRTIDDEGLVLDEVHVAADAGYLRRSMYFRNTFAHGAMTLRPDRALEVGGYREVGPCEDYDLWVRLLRLYPLGNVPDVLYRYRVYGSQISAKEFHHQRACFLKARAQLHADHPLPPISAAVVAREGLLHVSSYPVCRRTAQSYASDHFGLAVIMMRTRRWRQAAQLLLGVALFVLRRPRAAVGLPPLLGMASARHRVLAQHRRRRQVRD